MHQKLGRCDSQLGLLVAVTKEEKKKGSFPPNDVKEIMALPTS